MANCNHMSLGKYPCPNEAYGSEDNCILHLNTPGLSKEMVDKFKEELAVFIKASDSDIVLDSISFPQNVTISLPIPSNRSVILKDCKITDAIKFPSGITLESLSIINCTFHNEELLLSDLAINRSFILKDVAANNGIRFLNLSGKCRPELHIKNARSIFIDNIDFSEGISLNCEQLHKELILENSIINQYTSFRIENGASTVVIDNNKFLQRTDIILPNHPRDGLRLSNCSIDCLFIKNIDFTKGDKNTISLPYLSQSTIKSRKILAKSISKKDPEFNAFIKYLRNARDYFRPMTEHQEIYDHFYQLDLYFSRFKTGVSKQHKIVNWMHWAFSNYGYSIISPIVWLILVIAFFNFVYLGFDYCETRHTDNSFCWALLETFRHHIGQISFFRSGDEWFPIAGWKRTIMILEYIFLIPILTSIVISIKKVFKRA